MEVLILWFLFVAAATIVYYANRLFEYAFYELDSSYMERWKSSALFLMTLVGVPLAAQTARTLWDAPVLWPTRESFWPESLRPGFFLVARAGLLFIYIVACLLPIFLTWSIPVLIGVVISRRRGREYLKILTIRLEEASTRTEEFKEWPVDFIHEIRRTARAQIEEHNKAIIEQRKLEAAEKAAKEKQRLAEEAEERRRQELERQHAIAVLTVRQAEAQQAEENFERFDNWTYRVEKKGGH